MFLYSRDFQGAQDKLWLEIPPDVIQVTVGFKPGFNRSNAFGP